MTRREQREQIFMLLFRTEFHDQAQMDQQIEVFREYSEDPASDDDIPIKDRDMDYITGKCRGVLDRMAQIDEMLSGSTEKWSITRIGKPELTILRLGLYEMLYDDNIPVGVAINEAVELAKKYCQDGGGAFVNGILAKFAPEHVTGKEASSDTPKTPGSSENLSVTPEGSAVSKEASAASEAPENAQ